MHPSNGPRQDHAPGGRPAAIYGHAAITGGSLPAQLEAYQAFACQHGSVVPEAYVCLDDGSSGTRFERPGVQRLRELIRARAIQAVIVADLARLSRTWPHLLLLADECKDAEVTVHVVQSPCMPGIDDLRCLVHDVGANGGREEPCDEPMA